MSSKKTPTEIAERLNKAFSDPSKNSQKLVKILRETIKSNNKIHYNLIKDLDRDKKHIIEFLDLLNSLDLKIQFDAKSKNIDHK